MASQTELGGGDERVSPASRPDKNLLTLDNLIVFKAEC